jgi:NAD(P)H-dependent FMN reductase
LAISWEASRRNQSTGSSKALIRLAPHDLEFNEIPIGNLPLYSPDYDEDYPPEATALKEAIAGSDAVLFVTPEYNRSIPGALKNAIDWASRPWGRLLRSHSRCRDRRIHWADRDGG